MSDSESVVDELLAVGDDTVMPMPDISSKPHLLISKVRKHYMDYIIKQLSVNFKNNRSLFKKHGHLPSAIWRCAKSMELKAARASMVAQLYRKNILAMIIQVKNDTKNGNLNQTLSEFICTTPKNEKKIQAAFDQPLHFKSDIQNKRRKISKSPNNVQNPTPKVLHSDSTILQNTCDLKLLPSHYDSKPAKPKVIPATITSRQAEDEEELNQVKKMLVELFGEENDDNGLISPLEDNPDFINSCKERIAPWVLKLLTSRYKKGRIIGKALFKSVAKHLIKQICQCNKYPSEHQVKSVVLDFLKTHKMIKCEADYIEFTINHL